MSKRTPDFILMDDLNKSPSRAWLCAGAAVVIACWGFVGMLDYHAEREAECAAKRQPRMVYDSETDRCVPDPRYQLKESSNATSRKGR
jgi:hypothetical protein